MEKIRSKNHPLYTTRDFEKKYQNLLNLSKSKQIISTQRSRPTYIRKKSFKICKKAPELNALSHKNLYYPTTLIVIGNKERIENKLISIAHSTSKLYTNRKIIVSRSTASSPMPSINKFKEPIIIDYPRDLEDSISENDGYFILESRLNEKTKRT